MTEAELIETIVREVVRRLNAMGANNVATTTNGSAAVPPKSVAVGERVVAMASLNGRLDGVCQVVVRKDAIVTPLVMDELRDRNVALVRQDG